MHEATIDKLGESRANTCYLGEENHKLYGFHYTNTETDIDYRQIGLIHLQLNFEQHRFELICWVFLFKYS